MTSPNTLVSLDGSTLNVVGTTEGFTSLAAELADSAARATDLGTVEVKVGSTWMTVTLDGGPAEFRVQDDGVVSLRGSTQAVGEVVDHVAVMAQAKEGSNLHLQWFPEHHFMSASSLPVVLTKLGPVA